MKTTPRRWLMTGLHSLLVGVVIALASAWIPAALVPLQSNASNWDIALRGSRAYSLYSTHSFWYSLLYSDRDIPLRSDHVSSAMTPNGIDVEKLRQVLSQFYNRRVLVELPYSTPMELDYALIGSHRAWFGVPFRCLGWTQQSVTKPPTNALVIRRTKPTAYGQNPWRALPLRVHATGAALNILVSTTLAFLLIGGGSSLRRSLRHRRGLCPRCAYDLQRQFDKGCPECGWNRSSPSTKA